MKLHLTTVYLYYFLYLFLFWWNKLIRVPCAEFRVSDNDNEKPLISTITFAWQNYFSMDPNKLGMLPDHCQICLDHVGRRLWKKYEIQSQYEVSGRNIWGKILIFWCSLFHIFIPSPLNIKYFTWIFVYSTSLCLKKWFLFMQRLAWINSLQKHAITSRRGERPQALYISRNDI